MELLEFKEKFVELIGTDDLTAGVRDVLLSDRKDDVLSQYVELVDGDLETDNLQKIYQYYLADRGEKSQDFTPKSIAKLCARLTRTNGDTVLDLCAGSGALTIQKAVDSPNKLFICEELDDAVIPFLLFNLAVRNLRALVIQRDVLTDEALSTVFELTPGDRFSEIATPNRMPALDVSEVVSNPPYNIKWERPDGLFAGERFDGKPIPPAANANFVFVLDALARLAEGGRCAFVLPGGVLTSANERDVRAYLIDSGLIERVIMLPGSMFESTSIPVCVIVFSHGNKHVALYDCREKAVEEQRDQRGQFGGKSHTGRTYHKTINVLPDDLIDQLCGECEDVPGFSAVADPDAIEENDYNLAPSRYIEIVHEEPEHRPYKDIMDDINRVNRHRSIVKITCNEKLARQLEIDELAEFDKQAKEIDLNKTFEAVGGHYEHRSYITLTKSKVFKIENQDKEIWSHLMIFFIKSWIEFIYYLNTEENRLLAELRDAMLPDLMSGKIDVSNIETEATNA